jgi:hypothetical protein
VSGQRYWPEPGALKDRGLAGARLQHPAPRRRIAQIRIGLYERDHRALLYANGTAAFKPAIEQA